MAYEHNLGSAERYYGAIDAYRMANAAKTKTKIWVEQVSDAQEIFDFLQNEHSGFLNSMREAIANYGGLTDGQAGAVRKIMANRVCKDADKNFVIYKGSNYWGKGSKVQCIAKVKEHGDRNGVKQTIIQRPTKVTVNGEAW